MILHGSVTVSSPRFAAQAVAELFGGKAMPFPELGEHAWAALAGDDHGTALFFLERGREFHYVRGETVANRPGRTTHESGFHLLIETPHPEARVLEIARRWGCHAHRATHGPLDIIEFWIDECLLIEVATPELAAAYRALATSPDLEAALLSSVAA
ncbi:hypothetical protein [Sandaracinobacteroides saxicola]|uniref:VOC family protein n=1 Tax=Sandaracinobacteroides saxicola TaxID=2759707 RepID=A0A7G5IJJ7_9SPHN|nr:hypothetical protein [Sandaracinobacteroides saxicola]QMW23539.1 hypothetical protein H3309_03295 [Sandaracinobacteroides saxicola]